MYQLLELLELLELLCGFSIKGWSPPSFEFIPPSIHFFKVSLAGFNSSPLLAIKQLSPKMWAIRRLLWMRF